MVLHNRVLKKIIGPTAEAVTGGYRKYCYADQLKERLVMGWGGMENEWQR